MFVLLGVAVVEKVKSVLSKVFSVNASSIGDDFSQWTCSQWDSLAQLRIVVELEKEFGCRFEPNEMGAMTDIASIVKIVGEKGFQF
jgi:acyl carrier protein